jgi:hypothetical protein
MVYTMADRLIEQDEIRGIKQGIERGEKRQPLNPFSRCSEPDSILMLCSS